jgi:hypothetical protein
VLAGINQDFKGAGPDLGAYESGAPLPWYGPRPENGSPVILAKGAQHRTPMTVSLLFRGQGRGVAIRFCTPDKGDVVAAIFDVSGKQAAKIVAHALPGQAQSLVWKGQAQGIYLMRLTQGENNYACRFLLR